MNQCIYVLGIHRSGTSAVAGVLQRLGVHMGDRLLGAHSSNQSGQYEDVDFVELNEKIVGDWRKPNLNVTEGHKQRFSSLVEARRDWAYWGMKDPRFCVTAKWLLPTVENVKVVAVSRPFRECVESLMVRDRLTWEEAESIQGVYRYHMGNFLAQTKHPVLLVEYPDLIDHTLMTVEGLELFVYGDRREGRAKAASLFVQKQLRHWGGREPKGLASIIIPAVNNVELTKKCVDSIREYTSYPHEIVLVDNGSESEQSKLLSALEPDHYLWFKEPLGYPAACNRGAEEATGDYIVLLNNDAEVTASWLGKLLGTLERSGADVVGPVMDFVANVPQKVEVSKDKLLEVPHLSMCLVMRRGTYGDGLDESYGAGNSEELAFCRGVRERGGRLLVDGSVFVHHEGHQTFMQMFSKEDFDRLLVENAAKFSRDTQPEGFGTLAVGIAVKNAKDGFIHDWTRLLMGGLRPGDTVLEPIVGEHIHKARNLICMNFLSTNKDTLLFIDADSSFNRDTVERLRRDERSFEFDIVQALMTMRTFPPLPLVFEDKEQPPAPYNRFGYFVNRIMDFPMGEVKDTAFVGMAFTLVRRWVVERLREPAGLEFSNWFDWHRQSSEDAMFCHKARINGAKIAVNTSVEVGHIGDFTYRWSDWKDKKELYENGDEDRLQPGRVPG